MASISSSACVGDICAPPISSPAKMCDIRNGLSAANVASFNRPSSVVLLGILLQDRTDLADMLQQGREIGLRAPVLRRCCGGDVHGLSLLGMSASREKIADHRHGLRVFLHCEVADVANDMDARVRNKFGPHVRLAARQQPVLVTPYDERFVRYAAQPAAEVRMTKAMNLEDVGERGALLLACGDKFVRRGRV